MPPRSYPRRQTDHRERGVHSLHQHVVAGTLDQIEREARQQCRPCSTPFALDVEPVAHEVEPACAGPGDTLFGADLVAHRDVTAIADAPAMLDGAQAEIEFLPAEEQCLVIGVPGCAANRMSGTDEGDRIE